MRRKTIPIEDVIKELRRELEMRKKLYPQWIQSGKLDRDRANIQFLRLQKALELLEEKTIPVTQQKSLFDGTEKHEN